MRKVIVDMEIRVELEVDDDIAFDPEKMKDAINELDYNFNSYDTEGKVDVNDYNIRDYFWKVI